jgi:alpha-tubulin suppressor-like RCC1 family protein
MVGVLASMITATTSCLLLLGVEEETLRQPSGSDGGTMCTSPDDCPGGEHGTPTCDQGVCGFQCEQGFDDCDGNLGCEAATTEDKGNCGRCGITCSTYCISGSCNDPMDVTAGGQHACAIFTDGGVWCWGRNEHGELGDETTTNRTQPVRVSVPAPALQVRAGGNNSTCALLADGTVWCWGTNGGGMLGLGTTDASVPSPTPLPLTDIQEIAVGYTHACALDMDHRLFCWGANTLQQVGNGSSMNALSPVQVAASVAKVSAGGFHGCAVKLDGSLACWGSNGSGQLGLGSSNTVVGVPTTTPWLTNVAEVACGGSHTCARTAVGAVCWGNNDFGQLGLGNTMNYNTPQPLDLANVTALSAGGSESGALVADKVYVWGRNNNGQLGTCNAADELEPTENGLSKIERLAVRGMFSCALTKTHTVLCWGDNQFGQLGDGTTTSRCTPAPVVWP